MMSNTRFFIANLKRMKLKSGDYILTVTQARIENLLRQLKYANHTVAREELRDAMRLFAHIYNGKSLEDFQ